MEKCHQKKLYLLAEFGITYCLLFLADVSGTMLGQSVEFNQGVVHQSNNSTNRVLTNNYL